jgi:hypothetical protein
LKRSPLYGVNASVLRSALLALSLLAMAGSERVFAQSTASLSGAVTDPTNAAIPAAQIVCTNTGTGVKHTSVSNAEGLFRFPDLPIGTYEVKVSSEGFAPLSQGGITLVTGSSIDLNLQLTVGNTTQTVEVTGSVPLIQTATSELQTTVDHRNMRELPLNGRNPLQLVSLATGAVNTTRGNTAGSFQAVNSQIAVNGNRGTDNTYQLDGVNYTDVHLGTAPVLPSPDALEEFTARTSNFSASESGAGANIQFSTRSGSNQFHGSAFEYLRNDALDARNFFSNSVTPFKRNQFGGTFGGPIRKDRTFFFGSYQGTRVVGGANPSVSTTPSAAQREGIFPASRTIVDPATGAPFPGNRIPKERFDPIATKLLAYVPLPNQANGTYAGRPHTDQNDDQYSIKVDHNFSSSDHLAARYYYDRYDFQEQTSPLPDIYGKDEYRNQNFVVSETHTFGPSLLMFNSFGYTRVPRERSAVLPTTMQELGAEVPPASGDAKPQLLVAITGYAGLSSGTPISVHPDTFEYRTRFGWARGKHMIQFGLDFIRNHEYALDQSRETGSWTFDGSRTALRSIANSGDAFADFLLGSPFFFTQHGASPQDIVENKWQPWIQDDWRITSRLTLNLGLRWEPWLPATDRQAPQVGFLPGVQSIVAPDAPAGLVFSGDPGLRHSIFHRDWNNLAPRIGLAWDPQGNRKSVIRAAYGVFFRPTPMNLQRFSGNIATFRGITINVSEPSSFADPYAGFPGGAPFPWTAPTASDLKDYKFLRPVATAALDPGTVTSYVQEWNLTVERQLHKDLSVSLAYVGNRMIKGTSSTEANPALYGPGATAANADSRRIYPGIGSLQIVKGFEFSNYNGLQFTVTKRAATGLTLLGNYVYSKCMDNNSLTTGSVSVINKLDPSKDYARCDFDVTHLMNASVVYAFPRTSLRGIAARIVNDWTLTSIVQVRSGSPFSVMSGRQNSLSGPTTNSGVNDLADQITADTSRPAGADQLQQWFNTAAYTPNALGSYGNSGRNSLTGPGLLTWDFGLLKDLSLTEAIRLQLRCEAFNVLNHANFGNPVANLSNANFGRVLTSDDPRVIQLAMRLSF